MLAFTHMSSSPGSPALGLQSAIRIGVNPCRARARRHASHLVPLPHMWRITIPEGTTTWPEGMSGAFIASTMRSIAARASFASGERTVVSGGLRWRAAGISS